MMHVRLVLFILFSFLETDLWSQKKAVFIICDGIPADVIESVETPNLDAIAAHGGYARAYVGGEKDGYSQSPTVSAVGYNHILTGTWSNKHNVWGNDIKDPNYHYWNIFRVAEQNPNRKTAIFSTWLDNRTKLVGDGLEKAGDIKIDYAFDGFENDSARFPHDEEGTYISNIDDLVSTEAARYIAGEAPDLSWIYLEFTDDMGHRYGDSPQLVDAVKKADAQVGRIWEAVKTREKDFDEHWMIVITTDHGRDATGMNHGGQSERERTTWIVTNVKGNEHLNQQLAAVDIMPSILRHLDIVMPEQNAAEIDGVPFIGKVSASNLKTRTVTGNVNLSWDVLDGTGSADVYVSDSDNFKKGGQDVYRKIGSVPAASGKFTFSAKEIKSRNSKILIKFPFNWLNTRP